MGGYQNRNQYECVPRFMGVLYFDFPAETRNISCHPFCLRISSDSSRKHLRSTKPCSAPLKISIEQHGDTVASETAGVPTQARTNGTPPVSLTLDLLQEFIGKLAEIRHIKPNYVQHGITCITLIHTARFARIGRRLDRVQTRCFQQRNDFFLLLLQAQIRDLPGKILHGEKSAASPGRCDAYGRKFGIENVFAMARRMHPSVMNRFGIGTDRDVFRDHCEFRAGLSDALVQGSLTRKLMGEEILMRHELCVLACGGGEGIIPLERLQPSCGTFAIRGVEKEFLVRRRMRRE